MPAPSLTSLGSFLVLCATCALVTAAPAKFDPALLDPHYPDMAEWAKAGVTGGVPPCGPASVQTELQTDLQGVIDAEAEKFAASAATSAPRIIQLAAGIYSLTSPLRLRSGVVVRGTADGSTKLHVKIRATAPSAPFARDGFSTLPAAVVAHDVHDAGLEDVVLSYDENIPSPPTLRTELSAFINNPGGRDDLWVVGMRFTRARDCWVTGCRILNSGTHPLMIEGSSHVTVAKTEIQGAHNKGEGAGSVVIARSSYTLLDEIRVSDIRHLLFEGNDPAFPCRYNVLVRSHLEVDVNFNHGDGGHNLVENCTIAVPAWHIWPPIGTGTSGQNQPPGPGNLFYRCLATRAFTATDRNFSIADDPERVYVVRDRLDKNLSVVRPFGDAPRANTLYPVH